MTNQIMVIKPYRWEGMWVFDDERVGLHREPFVAGADTLIDVAVEQKGLKDAHQGFLLLFSGDPFPGAEMELTWLRSQSGGDVYQWNEMEGWLCPALLKYFRTPPEKIYAMFKER
jgi:hypothetical protein